MRPIDCCIPEEDVVQLYVAVVVAVLHSSAHEHVEVILVPEIHPVIQTRLGKPEKDLSVKGIGRVNPSP